MVQKAVYLSAEEVERRTSKLISMLIEMGGIKEPFDLFEPYIWRDKTGDGRWHCEVKSVDGILASSEGMVLFEVVEDTYNQMLEKN